MITLGRPAARHTQLRRRWPAATIDWKALSERIGHSDVGFTMRQYVQTDLEVHRQVTTSLADLILGGLLSSGSADPETDSPNGQDVA